MTLSGTLVQGEIWTLSIDGLTYDVTVDDGTLYATVDDIAAKFATDINNDAGAAEYTAEAFGAVLIIVNPVQRPAREALHRRKRPGRLHQCVHCRPGRRAD